MAEEKGTNRLPIKGVGMGKIIKDFDIIFIERINHGYDKNLNNTMFHWELNKLFDLTEEPLLDYIKKSGSNRNLSTSMRNSFIKKLSNKTTVAILEQDNTFTPFNHPEYNLSIEEETEEDTELF